MKREQKITPGGKGIAVVRKKIRRCRLWRLDPRRRHHRDSRLGASADRGQPCRLAVGRLQKVGKARQIAKARRLVEASRLIKAGRPGETYGAKTRGNAETPHCKACRPGAGRLEPLRAETNMRSGETPDRSRCGTYRGIRRRDQCP